MLTFSIHKSSKLINNINKYVIKMSCVCVKITKISLGTTLMLCTVYISCKCKTFATQSTVEPRYSASVS